MHEAALIGYGLTRNEARVYLGLLHLGKARSGEIIREAQVSAGKIYETLYKLIDKGLVKEISEQGVKHFFANDPQSLLIYLQERRVHIQEQEQQLQTALPSLLALRKMTTPQEGVALVKGLRGITPIVYGALTNAKEIRIVGVRSSKEQRFNNFWRKWHQERVVKKKQAKILFSDKNTAYWNFFKKLKYTTVRELSHISPSATMIIDDQVFLLTYEEDIICVHIISRPIAVSLTHFFDDLWSKVE